MTAKQKNCVSCHHNFVVMREDEPERFADFCQDCLRVIQDSLHGKGASAEPAHKCDLCQIQLLRVYSRAQFWGAAAWAFMWFCAGLLASELVGSWLFQGG